MRHAARFLVAFLVAGIGLLPGALAAGTDSTVMVPGWSYQVIASGLPGVDGLALDAGGALYATLELKNLRGSVVRIADSKAETILPGLDRPDGLAARDGKLYIAEEVNEGRMIEFDLATRKTRVLAILRNPEGIDFLPGGDLVVSEDIPGGRVVRLGRTGEIEALAEGLNRPEGLSVAGDGVIAVAETRAGRVIAINGDGGISTIVDGLNEPDQVRWGPDGALWITEDARPGRLLRFKNGSLQVIAEGLSAPQGMAFTANGDLLLAEQGRGRVLVFRRAGGFVN